MTSFIDFISTYKAVFLITYFWLFAIGIFVLIPFAGMLYKINRYLEFRCRREAYAAISERNNVVKSLYDTTKRETNE